MPAPFPLLPFIHNNIILTFIEILIIKNAIEVNILYEVVSNFTMDIYFLNQYSIIVFTRITD